MLLNLAVSEKRFLIVHHQDRLAGRVETVAPERSFRIYVIPLARHRGDRQVYELVVHEPDDQLGLSGHGRVHGVVAEALAVNRVDGRGGRRADLVARVDVL